MFETSIRLFLKVCLKKSKYSLLVSNLCAGGIFKNFSINYNWRFHWKTFILLSNKWGFHDRTFVYELIKRSSIKKVCNQFISGHTKMFQYRCELMCIKNLQLFVSGPTMYKFSKIFPNMNWNEWKFLPTSFSEIKLKFCYKPIIVASR